MSKRTPITDPIQENDPYPYFEMIVAANPEELEPGVIFEHAVYTPDELACEVIKYAIKRGWQDAEAAELVDGFSKKETPESFFGMGYKEGDWSQILADVAFDASNSATDYLDELAPEGFWVGNDGEAGAFGVWRITDEGEE